MLRAMLLFNDTTPQGQRRYIELISRLSAVEKLNKAFDLSSAVRLLTKAGIMQALPHASENERSREFIRRCYGDKAVTRLERHLSANQVRW